MKFYDVVIVGAGPAGLACAKKLSEAGRKVLLLEQNSEIGPKVCAGGLIKDNLGDSKIPEDLFEYKFKDIFISNGSKEQLLSASDDLIYMIDRKELGQWQFRKISEDKNITIKINSRVSEISQNFVIVNGIEKIGFKYLVGSDGSSSLVRRFLGIKTSTPLT